MRVIARSRLNVVSIAVKTAYIVPQRAKTDVYGQEESGEAVFKTELILCFPFCGLANFSSIQVETLVIMMI